MNTFDQINVEAAKLSLFSRFTRLVLGALLLGFPMSHQGELGAMTLLPLLAIYPILSAAIGYGLVSVLISSRTRINRTAHLGTVTRVLLVALGAGLIGSVMAGAALPVWVALLGIAPILAGVLGSDLAGEAVVTQTALKLVGGTAVHATRKHSAPVPTVGKPVSAASEFGGQKAA